MFASKMFNLLHHDYKYFLRITCNYKVPSAHKMGTKAYFY